MTHERNEDRKMDMYTATVEVGNGPKRLKLEGAGLERVLEQLSTVHGAVGISPRGWRSATVSVPGESLVQAAALAVTMVEAALGDKAIAVEIATEAESDAREGFTTLPELVGVTEAAQMLGVTRQAVLDRITRKTLPAEKVGNGYAIPRSAVVVAPTASATARMHPPTVTGTSGD